MSRPEATGSGSAVEDDASAAAKELDDSEEAEESEEKAVDDESSPDAASVVTVTPSRFEPWNPTCQEAGACPLGWVVSGSTAKPLFGVPAVQARTSLLRSKVTMRSAPVPENWPATDWSQSIFGSWSNGRATPALHSDVTRQARTTAWSALASPLGSSPGAARDTVAERTEAGSRSRRSRATFSSWPPTRATGRWPSGSGDGSWA